MNNLGINPAGTSQVLERRLFCGDVSVSEEFAGVVVPDSDGPSFG